MRRSNTENKYKNNSMKNKANKTVSKTMIEKAEVAFTEMKNCHNGMSTQVKGLKIDSKKVEGGRYMRASDGKLCFDEKERGKVCKEYMDRIMNEENDWNHVEGDTI